MRHRPSLTPNLPSSTSGWSVPSSDGQEWEPLEKATLWTGDTEFTTSDAEIKTHDETAEVKLRTPLAGTGLPADLEGVGLLATRNSELVRSPDDSDRQGPNPALVKVHEDEGDHHILTIPI
jgi:hypothetical protein